MKSELYEELKSGSNFLDAYFVIKNLLSKNSGDKDIFAEFIDLSLTIAALDIDFDERKQYVNEANTALVFFSESTDVDENTLAFVKEVQNRINNIIETICREEDMFYIKKQEAVQDYNNKLLNELAEKNNQLFTASTQSDFDDLLSEVASIENKLRKDLFSEVQKETYETLTKCYSQTISSKMEDLNHNGLLVINKKAIYSFKEVFDSFTKNKAKYKDIESNLKALMTSKFFVFDTQQLFNESLIYYNHVYAMIFQEVSDDLKFKLTDWSLQTPKIKSR